ncbi:carbohydrate kinase family protein [Bacteroidetes bacterium endosymbiont of Geopemphigus sp.]|uniref:carbohydrate kinase family protein n=1 Tax=Bacteroidetes bacterium endosymbiont of Geopemphigus sp. TaxID=2047937 RepID=UPI000CD1FE2A|nr:carbohydrate kinase [Bacteroidetes bacterium endosymbiont of Geopemphigus sp.]
MSAKKIICYGEILWDRFPSGLKPGGAPLNVAYHLKKMGIDSHIISRVGKDMLGKKLLKIIDEWGISHEFCRVDENYPTGEVISKVDTINNEVNYEIIAPVAWDFITKEKAQEIYVQRADAFVFQSLTGRNDCSKKTLYALLEQASYKVFDVNLRPPFYTQTLIKDLMKNADLVKMNLAELQEVISWIKSESSVENDAVSYIKEHFKIDKILITKGNNGATYYAMDATYDRSGIAVKVKDTVGSGDAFLAGFLSKIIEGKFADEAMDQGTLLGAFITTKEGACPDYSFEDLKTFRHKHQI